MSRQRKVKTHYVQPGCDKTQCGWALHKLQDAVWSDNPAVVSCKRCLEKSAFFKDELISTHQILPNFPELTMKQLDGWVRAGWIHAAVPHPGLGKTRLYSPDWVVVIAAMNMMVNKIGMNPNIASPLARQAVRIANLYGGDKDDMVTVEHNGIRVGLPWKELRRFL